MGPNGKSVALQGARVGYRQWGVALGKVLARRIAAQPQADAEPQPAHDPSTNALTRHYRSANRR